ncbi:putative serine hydrolase [Podospora fimiseda]|uniref:Serine hydrolase n=1 Tax=Podospora fimiseda TaxID=252190 RepID=A0AAN6YL82_9PEZI|nr:putative serine hydrolase [Podospora fimiseda]
MTVTAKPKILLLHGSGTNPTIFQIQSRRLTTLLSPHFDLFFLPGPIECPPGPGVLPYFEGAGPYLKWIPDSPTQENELYFISGLPYLIKHFEKNGPFVGVIGFSQGAKAGTYLVRHLEREERGVKFFVSVCGTAPFKGKGKGFVDVLKKLGRNKTKNMHFIGLEDPWRPESEAAVGLWEGGEDEERVRRVEGGHHMLIGKEENEFLREWILDCC